ncbi:MAG: 16S rRNA (cytosine(967)-C(5))-methyltransferase RsmB [Blastocatellales bacterium]
MKLNISPARAAAFDVLMRVVRQNSFASNLLAAPRFDKLSREDRALLQELTLGVLRWQGRLDFLIERHTRREVEKLDLELIIALRLGLYQLLFLSRVPAFAAINESVNLVKEFGKPKASGLANAVLRSAQRELQFTILPSGKSQIHRLSVEISHPVWLVKRWIARFGETQAREMALAHNSPPQIAFRFSSKVKPIEETKADLEWRKIVIRPSALTPEAFVIESGNLSAKSEPVTSGWIYLQDEASQLIARLAAQRSKGDGPARILDLCAAPGSKTTLLASELSDDSMVVASDIHFHRLRTLKEFSERLSIKNIRAIRLDGERQMPFEPESFDVVLLDAPCSGLGTLQRNPEIKWRIREEKIIELADLQKRLLVNAAEQVKDGGLLVYSVCSTEPEEGEEVISWFRSQHSEFRDLTRERLIELGIDPAPLLTSSFGARTFTHRQGTESFFFCVLWKRKTTD